MVRRLLSVCGMVLVVLSLAGMPLRTAAQSDTAQVRFVHAAPDAPDVDVFLDGETLLTDVAFATISDYVAVPAGAHKLAVAPAGQGAAAAIMTAEPSFAAGQAYTVAAVNLEGVSVQVYTDDLSVPPAGKARVRVIHLSPDAPSANVEVVDGPTLIEDLAFPEASDYLSVDAGTYNLRVVAVSDNTVFIQLPNTELEVGTIYDVVAVGRLASIQVTVGTSTPMTTGNANTQAATNDERAQTVMPGAGVYSSMYLLVLGFALFTIGGGLILRRRSA